MPSVEFEPFGEAALVTDNEAEGWELGAGSGVELFMFVLSGRARLYGRGGALSFLRLKDELRRGGARSPALERA